ncbi:MAG: hypothetical protein COY40_01125 [Alphaproteobacteria bacterium CG_4_10_14_0_8_um_filter_53_9]|nr:MAG: hypothetical protein COY40_01125 [Alphaproteobacteria bacterium CG_4_10_14_0_8_um_filter_53_9]
MAGNIILCSKGQAVASQLAHVLPNSLSFYNVLCITTPANTHLPEKRTWQDDEMQAFEAAGLKLQKWDIAEHTEDENARVLGDADIVYVTGGNVYYLLEQMNIKNIKPSLEALLARGGTYIGCSAGAAVVCQNVAVAGDLDDVTKSNLKDFTGLSLVPFNLMVHTDNQKYAEKIAHLIEKQRESKTPLITLRDNEAISVHGSIIEVIPCASSV